MRFCKCFAITSWGSKFSHCILNLVEKHIPQELITYFDQTPSKYVPVNKSAKAHKDSTSVPKVASEDKRITATFAIKPLWIILTNAVNLQWKNSYELTKIQILKNIFYMCQQKALQGYLCYKTILCHKVALYV